MSTEINLINKIVVLDEGTIITSDAKSLNFTGSGVTATSSDGDVTINITGGGGGGGSVTDVTASTPLFSTGGSAPNITIQQASALQAGYLSSTDWTTFNNKVSSSLLGANNGVATLDGGGKVPVTQLPNSIMDYKGTYDIVTNTPTLVNGTGNAGDVYINTAAGTRDFGAGPITVAIGDWLVYDGSVWQKTVNSNAVASVNGYTGIVVLNKSDIGLSNVENTALSTWAGSTNITTLGTIGTGVWQGTAIADTYISSAATWNAKQDALVSGVNIKTINTNSLLGSGNLTINESPIFLEYNLTDKTVWNNGQGNIVSNTSFGDGSLRVNTTGLGNTGIGAEALKDNTTGDLNTGIGAYALTRNTTGGANTAAGHGALAVNTNGYANTAFGRSALTLSNSTNQTAVGSYALSSSTSSFDNTAVGSAALRDATTGNNNTAVGTEALSKNTTSSFNSAFGRQALRDNTTGTGNSSFGAHSLWSIRTGNNNSAFGIYTLQLNTTGSDNTVIGSNSLSNNLLGGNTAVGAFSGVYLANGTTGNANSSNSLFLGAYTKSGVASSSNEIVIGYNAIGNGSNTTTIGRQGTTTQTLLAGSLKINNIYTLPNIDGTANQVLQTNGAGIVSWATVSGGGGGTVSSVGLSMPSAFTVTNSPVTGSGVLTVTGAGTTSDYIRGDGSLAAFPTGLPTSEIIQDVKLGEAIPTGYAVYVFTADGTNIIVKKASNDAESTSSKTLGLLVAGGALNFQTTVLTNGRLSGLDTSTATIGDAVWLGTGGQLLYGLINKPYAPAHLVYIGVVTRVNGSNGEIFVSVQNGFELDELHNVDARNPSNNDGIFYNTTNSLWEHKSIATVLGYTPVAGSGTINYLSKFTAAGTIGDSAVFESGGNVGIGTNTPTASLHINNIGTGNSFLVEDSTNPDTTPFLIDSDGNVAVGSSSAYSSSKLDIYAGNTARVPLSLRRADSAADHMVFVKEDTNTQWWIALTSDDFRLYNSTATDNILFGVNGGSADTGNKVGIGTATPSAKLDVNGNVKISTIANATTDTDKFLVSDSGVIKYRTGTEVLSDIGGISLSSISANTPLSYDSGTGAFSIQIATAAQNGYLSFADWNTFNGKQAALGYTPANIAGDTFTGSISATNLSGTNTGDETTSTIKTKLGAASGSQDGYLTSTNWTTFNSKQDTISLTTTGTSGAATLIGNTLNIPQYTGSTFDYGLSYAIASQNILL